MMSYKPLPFIFALLMFVFGFAQASHAEAEWKVFTSKSDMFRVLLPGEPSETVTPFRIGIDQMLMDVHVVAHLEGTSTVYRVDVSQTFGSHFSNEVKNTLIKREFEKIEKLFKDQGGILHSTTMIEIDGEYAGEIYLSYMDKQLNAKQAVRAIVTATKDSLFVQSVTGSEEAMFTLKTKDFLSSLKFRKIKKERSEDEQEWSSLESTFKLFELQVPPVVLPYVSSAASVQGTDRTEIVSQVFNDPVWDESVYYKVYGYRFETKLTTANVQQVMIKNHIRKHGRDPNELQFGQSFAGGIPSLELTYQINPPKGYPYLNTVRLRALYLDNTAVIQEMIGPRYLVDSEFMRNTYELIDFSPKAAFKQQALERLQGGMKN